LILKAIHGFPPAPARVAHSVLQMTGKARRLQRRLDQFVTSFMKAEFMRRE